MATQKLKGLWIPAEILLNEELSDKEKIILAMILYLSEETKTCFASNKYIANIVNVTADRVSKIISSLKEKEYISVKFKYKTDSKEIEERQITPKLKNINRYSQKCLEGIDTNNYSASQKQLDPIGDNDKDIINNIKNKNNYNKGDTQKKKNIPYRSDICYDEFDWNSLYANYKKITAT
ncbi:helix-turn-helix domain-containing protein [Gemella morbillorum]